MTTAASGASRSGILSWVRALALVVTLAAALVPSPVSAQTTNLLRAVATDVAVSSVYRNRARQALEAVASRCPAP